MNLHEHLSNILFEELYNIIISVSFKNLKVICIKIVTDLFLVKLNTTQIIYIFD